MNETPSADLFYAADRDAWRAWLEEHHAVASEVWLLQYKRHTGRVGVGYEEAVEEALCFGWIDGKLRRIDDEKHMLRFSPRKPGSVWAESNRARVQKLIDAGRMTPAGLAAVQAAKDGGAWDAAAREPLDVVPDDLGEALAADPSAAGNFAAFTLSQRKQYIYWVVIAKRPATRQRRVSEVVARSAQNLKPGA